MKPCLMMTEIVVAVIILALAEVPATLDLDQPAIPMTPEQRPILFTIALKASLRGKA
ncbi:MAG: hypothetical protein AAB881_01325 [Patescibacteria group bacterium]